MFDYLAQIGCLVISPHGDMDLDAQAVAPWAEAPAHRAIRAHDFTANLVCLLQETDLVSRR